MESDIFSNNTSHLKNPTKTKIDATFEKGVTDESNKAVIQKGGSWGETGMTTCWQERE